MKQYRIVEITSSVGDIHYEIEYEAYCFFGGTKWKTLKDWEPSHYYNVKFNTKEIAERYIKEITKTWERKIVS
jgi:hypothetical protein